MRCEDCGNKDVKVIGFSGNYYCQECFDKLTIECAECGKIIKAADGFATSVGNILCRSCYNLYESEELLKNLKEGNNGE